MRSNLRFWLALSLMLVAGAIVVWFKGRPQTTKPGTVAWSQPQPQATTPVTPALLTTPSVLAANGTQAAPTKTPGTKSLAERYQLKNVDQQIDALTRVESAILMKNALIDTRQAVELPIPPDLRAGENPGAYIVQANRAPTAEFQNMLKDAGAEIVAYVPNNAFLVKAGATVAANLEQRVGVNSVLPYEPYYKLDLRLMKFAVDHEPMPKDAWLRVTLFSGGGQNVLAPLADAISTTEKSPFGNQVLILPRPGALAQLAQLPEVQIIEPWNARIRANDLTRVRLGISTNTTTPVNHLGLTGEDIWVNVNDVGVDATHDALAGRVFYNGNDGKVDLDGHGTHVAATIAGGPERQIFDNLRALGTNSMRSNYVTVTDDEGVATTTLFVDGSETNADFRGMAHNAKLFVLSTESSPGVNEPVTDTYLIETAARTNYQKLDRNGETLISNNSWNYANTTDYDSQAARFDAATRDALPDDTGSQPITFVFAAGNQGFGGEDGQGGEPGTIASPGTAKNVITVGALEAPRFIAEALTNVEERVEIDDDGQPQTNRVTNLVQLFRPITDSADQVASFSSRGNVGMGVEGASGRFKPDLVAPGTFIWSARSSNWNLVNDFPTNDPAGVPMFNVLSNLNAISSKYRYDSGTSFSAPGVSGLLALIQEFFSHDLPSDRRRNLSPAMMKALLLNAARPVNALYDYDPRGRINYQGWGLVDLRNLITATVDDQGRVGPATLASMPKEEWPLQLIDETPDNALATGEDLTWSITLDTNALSAPLRFTLVWTDPPGNPQVGVKLVNDLDLTVEVGNRVFYGNDFITGTTVSRSRELGLDNPDRDSINNVEKIIIAEPESFTTNGAPIKDYTIRVTGRRVNVKSVNDYYEITGRTNEIVQDFALVVSADNYIITNAFPKFQRATRVNVSTNVITQPVYNGLEATNQRVGANSPLYWTNGNSVQWRFYVFTNSPNSNAIITNIGLNVAFITSAPLNIGDPRNFEPDIDLYVSKDPELVNLRPSAVNAAWKSTTRFGTEQVVFAPTQFIMDANGNPTTDLVTPYDPAHPDLGGVIVGQVNIGDVFYIGVKSEDQKAGEFSLIAVSTDRPFEEERDGVRVISLIPAPSGIPDGTPNLPRGRRYFGVPLRGGRIADTSVYMGVQHELFGDLVGTLGLGSTYATLNNHSLPLGFTNFVSLIYSDYPYAAPFNPNEYPVSLYDGPPGFDPPFGVNGPTVTLPDGPRTLVNYTGLRANQGTWTLDMVDSAASHIGTNWQAEVHVKPLKPPLLSGELVKGTVRANGQDFYPLDVPGQATRVTVTLTLPAGINTNVLLLVRKDLLPGPTNADYAVRFSTANTVTITFDRNSQPPLIPGEYIVGVANEGNIAVDYELLVTIETDSSGAFQEIVESRNIPLKDDATTESLVDHPLDQVVTEASVAVLADHARISDVVLRLTSPQGTSVILSENRGFFDPNGFGSILATTNFPGPSYAVFTEDAEKPIKFTLPPFGDSSTTRGFIFGNSFEGAAEGVYSVGQTFDGWQVNSNTVYVLNGDAAQGNVYVNLGDGRPDTRGQIPPRPGAISQTVPTIKGRPYRLSFAYRGKSEVLALYRNGTGWTNVPRVGPLFGTGRVRGDDALGAHTNGTPGAVDPHYRIINNPDLNFPPPPGQSGSTMWIAVTNQPPFPNWLANDTNSQWIALMPQNDTGHPVGVYTNRTSFIISEDPNRVYVNGRATADDRIVGIRVNGAAFTALMPLGPSTMSAPFTISGMFRSGLNMIDFIVTNSAVGPVGLRADLRMAFEDFRQNPTNLYVTNSQTVGFMKLIGATNEVFSVTGAAEWRRFETEFIADQDNMRLQFYAGTNFPGVDIDDVVLEDTGTVFMQPEEPLAILEGERAMGEWKLEALDNRTGAVVPSIIHHWQLILGTAAAPRLAEPLAAGGITYPGRINNPVIRANTNLYTPGRILAGETEWFYYDICDSSTVATIALSTTRSNNVPLELLVDRSGFPTGDPETDDYEILRTVPGTNSTVLFQLRPTNPLAAPLQPGRRLYIGVRAAQFPTTTNETFRIGIQPNGCAFVVPTILSAGQSFSEVAFPAAPENPGTTYQTSASSATSVSISAEGNLTLLASNGTEPTPGSYQLRQTVSNGSATLQLPAAGTWYFRVVNETAAAVPYTISVAGQGSSNIRSVSIVDNHLSVTWQSAAGTSYEIATSTDLVNWTPLTTIQATGSETTYNDPQTATGTMRFIRIRPL